MKTIKLKKSDLNMTLEDLLRKFGLVNGCNASPEKLFMSQNDIKTLKKNITKKFKKDFPHLTGAKINTSVSMYFLNLGPSDKLAKVLKDGYVIIGE